MGYGELYIKVMACNAVLQWCFISGTGNMDRRFSVYPSAGTGTILVSYYRLSTAGWRALAGLEILAGHKPQRTVPHPNSPTNNIQASLTQTFPLLAPPRRGRNYRQPNNPPIPANHQQSSKCPSTRLPTTPPLTPTPASWSPASPRLFMTSSNLSLISGAL